LCDRIGNRVSGSAALEKAIVWAEQEMKRAGSKRPHDSSEGSALGTRSGIAGHD